MSDPRSAETALARFTLGALAIYFPVETWVSLPYGLANPFYLVDLIAMLLMLAGARRSLRARPRPAPALLATAYGWAAANGWRATWQRAFEVYRGGTLDHGTGELWAVATATAIALGCLALSLYLVVRAERPAAVKG